ncbi:MAG: phosphoglycerate mutase family protein [Candidatus Thorarchaeota archaeon]|nr:phosphoglycerate mutase family protein [Candidatus Thorarchaeota archaeon]
MPSEWESEEWLHSAKNLIEWVSKTPIDSQVMLLVRHSHRETIKDHTAQLSTELTPLGCRMSTEMGRRLPSNRKTIMFFSFVTRCYQTAQELGNGLSENGGAIDDMDALAVLATPEVISDDFWKGLQPDGKNITEFVNNWADGVFEGLVEPFEDYKQRFVQDIVERISNAESGSLHIHITHDLALMAAKRILMPRAIGYDDREPFLGGIGLMIQDEEYTLYSSGETFHISKIEQM